ncbi:MAG: helix-turn-helix domain-containing protein [Lacipirellulaceae bacterium]
MKSKNSQQTRILLKPAQAAESLEISQRKLWSMTNSGEIPHVRIGRSVRYPVEDLRRYIYSKLQGGKH